MNNRTNESLLIKDFNDFIIMALEHKLDSVNNVILDLSKSLLSSHDLKQLAETLKLVPHVAIRKLKFDKKLDNRGLKYLAPIFKNCSPNSKILSRILDLSDREIDHEGAEYLANILQYTRENFQLKLCGSTIDDLGLYYLARRLKEAPPGFKLNLARIYICFRKNISINLALLITNAPLRFSLDLSGNGLKDDAAIEIAEHLKLAKPGLKINLNNNDFFEAGIEAITSNLQNAPERFQLQIKHDSQLKYSIDITILEKLVNALSKARQVISLEFSTPYVNEGNSITPTKRLKFHAKEILKKNRMASLNSVATFFSSTPIDQRNNSDNPKDLQLTGGVRFDE